MSVERYVATAGVTFTTDPDGPWVPYYRYAKLEAKCERLERERDEYREMAVHSYSVTMSGNPDSPCAICGHNIRHAVHRRWKLEGREP